MSNRLSAPSFSNFGCRFQLASKEIWNGGSQQMRKGVELTRELARIMACLENHSVDAIPYKGPALAQAIYGDVAMRQFSDLDILIRVSESNRRSRA